MICKWCKGTYEECGCGQNDGHCCHCNHGEVTNPPYGPQRYLIAEDYIGFNQPEINWDLEIDHFWINVSLAMTGRNVLTEEDVKMFSDYWIESEFRDETIGEVIQRCAMLVRDCVQNCNNRGEH